ncbi:MAG: hypothetical protein VW405_22820 [Rhodospirillaceae bacterium]
MILGRQDLLAIFTLFQLLGTLYDRVIAPSFFAHGRRAFGGFFFARSAGLDRRPRRRADAWQGGARVPSTPCGRLKDALESKGYLVAAPVMPRGRGRIYDKDYEASMQEIAGLVAELKAKGAERVVLAGHSLGGNAALGYAVSRVGIAGLISLATGHQLENHFLKQQGLGEAVAKAKVMIDAGKGDEIDAFADFNMKPQPPARTTARIY